MLKNVSKLEFVIADKAYHFLCDSDSPLPHVKEALFQFLKFAGQIEDQVKVMEAQQQAQQAKSDEPKPEEVKNEQPVAN